MMWGSPMMGGWGGFGSGFGLLGLAFMAVFWVAIIVGVVLVIRWLVQGPGVQGGGAGAPGGRSRALEIVMERYAKGEITKEQFDQMKRDLGG